MVQAYDQLIKDIKNKIFHPIYFLQGEEPYFIDKVSDLLEQSVLTEGERGFNQTILYGKDSNVINLLDILRRYPMMSNHQVVILKEAQDFKELDKLESYFKNPLKTTIFVICHKYKTIRKGTNFQKLVEKESAFFNSEKLKDTQLTSFVNNKVSASGFKIEPNAAQLIVEYLGNDLNKVEMELSKLELNVPKEKAITTHDIETFIGISKEYNSFELVHAIAAHNVAKAFKITDHFIRNPKDNPAIVVLATLYGFYNKAYGYMAQNLKAIGNDNELMKILGANYYQVQDLRSFGKHYTLEHTERAIAVLHEYDLKFKGINATGSAKEQLMTEMVFKLLG